MINQLKNLLYIFQLSEYDSAYFLNWVKSHPKPTQWKNLEKKSKLKWTFKARILFFLASIFLSLGFYKENKLPYALLKAQKIIHLFEQIRIWQIVWQVKSKLASYQKLKTIGIAGSFGKTTAKEYIAHILSQKYKVIKTPENINTILGVANFILQTDFSDADFFIVEIGAYHKGDVKRLCDIIKPQIGVLTGIGHEHIERFGNINNVIDTEFEIIESLPSDGILLLHLSQLQNANQKIKNNKIKFKIFELNYENDFNVKNLKWGIGDCEADIYKGNEFLFKTNIPVVAQHQLELALAALIIGEEFGLNKIELKIALKSLPQVLRRLTFSQTSQDILILDDSYNATIEGMEAALKVLNRFKNYNRSFLSFNLKDLEVKINRCVVLSAGIPETGAQKRKIHNKLGALYVKYCDLLLLVENSTTLYIIEGINSVRNVESFQVAGKDKNFKGVKNEFVKVFKDAQEAQSALPQILKSGDIILIQAYDWPDHYY